jgi:hypothetical protein
MRLVLPALALCGLMFSLGCGGMDLAKKDGEQRRAAGGSGIGGMTGGSDMLSSPTSPVPSTPAAEQPAAEPAPAETPPAEASPPAEPAPPAEAPPPANTTAAEDAVTVGARSNDPNTTVIAAKRGVGKTGRYEGSGMVITPIKSYFLTKQRIELELKVPQAMNLYKATNGHFPKTVEEFNSEIIEFNGIKLPELPKGHRYVYDPQDGLGVEVPAK